MQSNLKEVEKEIAKRGISKDKVAEVLSDAPQVKNRRIIGGYASVAIYDREGHRITLQALKDAVPRFMEESYYRPITVFHSDITAGRILPKWHNPETGELYETKVDDTGWYIVAEVRDDVEIADKIWAEIEKGNIKSFSIAGSSKKKVEVGGGKYDIEALDIYETALCETPVNQLSKFSLLWNPQKVDIGTGLDN